MQNCVFCKIASGSIKTQPVFESNLVLAINDINPKAPIHILIMPKEHIQTMDEISHEQKDLCFEMFNAVSEVFKAQSGKYSGFNIVCNNGAAAGQSVDHLHWHFLAGKNIYSSGFKL